MPLRQLKVIIALDGTKPLLSTTVVAPAALLTQANAVNASLLMGADGFPSMLVVQMSCVPSASPSEPALLATEDGRVLTAEGGTPLVLAAALMNWRYGT